MLLHVPKTGGTTLRNTLGMGQWFKRHHAIGNPRMTEVVQRAGDNAHVFTFARDPLDRAVSAYYFFKNSRENTDKPPKGFSHIKQKAWLFSVVAHAAQMDANQFYRGLHANGRLQLRRMHKVEPHFIPLHYWIKKAEGMGQPIHYYNFHDFANEYHRLLDDLGAQRRPPLKHMMKSRRPRWKDELEPDVIELLKDWLAEDYKILDAAGIEVESASL